MESPIGAMLHAAIPFIAGGIAGSTATCIIQPIDTIKVHKQLPRPTGSPPPTTLQICTNLISTSGASAFYRGLGAALGRQVVYGSARLGLFRTFSEKTQARNNGHRLTFFQKAICGVFAGGLSSILGNPFDLTLVRMQMDRTLPESQRRNYRGVLDALVRIPREEGILGLWRGCTPTVVRAMVLNAAMLATADQAKESLAPFFGEKSVSTSLFSSLLSGLAASVASLPADMVKTRLQSMRPDPRTGLMPYAGFIDCAGKIVASEGVHALWSGLGTYTMRIGPHAFFTLMILDGITPRLRELVR